MKIPSPLLPRRGRLVVLLALGATVGAATTLADGAVTYNTTTKATEGRVYVASAGLDSNPCTHALPCLTFQRGYQAAAPGQTVEIAGGAYPPQRLTADPSKESSTDRVVFNRAPGSSVSVARLSIGDSRSGARPPQHIVVANMYIGLTVVAAGSSDISLQSLTGAWFDILGGDHVSVLGGSFGPCQAPAQGGCTPRLIGTNQRVEGATIHGMSSTDPRNYHVDGMFIRGCQGCVVARSLFYGNMITNIRLQNCCSLPANQDVTIENSWFAAPLQGDGQRTRADGINVDNPTPNLLIRNNSFAQNTGISFAPGTYDGTNTRVVNNLMLNLPCTSGVAYENNLFIPFSRGRGNTPCSGSDRQVPSFGYTDPSAFDYHLLGRSPAIGRGSAESCATKDIDGRTRPRALPCDVGSDQRRDTLACRQGKKRSKTVWMSGIVLRTEPLPQIKAGPCPKRRS